MTINEKQEALVKVHNLIADISVKGNDTIAMANALLILRQVINGAVMEENNGDT